AVAEDGGVVLRQALQDREHHVLPAQVARVLDLQILGEFQEVGGGFAFQFLKVHGNRGKPWGKGEGGGGTESRARISRADRQDGKSGRSGHVRVSGRRPWTTEGLRPCQMKIATSPRDLKWARFKKVSRPPAERCQ